MTTLVKVLNEGPNDVKIEVQDRTSRGQIHAASEHKVRCGEFKSIYVHATQSLQVIELPTVSAEPA